MSIWASLHTLTGDDGTAPWAYQGAGHLPTRADDRRGYLDLAHIPGHITRGEPCPHHEDLPWPWLRLTVNGSVTVLDADQATELAVAIGDWLADQLPADGADTPHSTP